MAGRRRRGGGGTGLTLHLFNGRDEVKRDFFFFFLGGGGGGGAGGGGKKGKGKRKGRQQARTPGLGGARVEVKIGGRATKKRKVRQKVKTGKAEAASFFLFFWRKKTFTVINYRDPDRRGNKSVDPAGGPPAGAGGKTPPQKKGGGGGGGRGVHHPGGIKKRKHQVFREDLEGDRNNFIFQEKKRGPGFGFLRFAWHLVLKKSRQKDDPRLL